MACHMQNSCPYVLRSATKPIRALAVVWLGIYEDEGT